ncbi:MAG: LapA family protein [Deltaproteobacteria bacterium]|nr:LapA family protein [Candidatus Anaeroferrophillacea bacterium]
MRVKLYAALALGALVSLFIMQNIEIVEVRFMFWHLMLSRAVLLLGTLAAGVVIGLLLGGYVRRGSRPRLRSV